MSGTAQSDWDSHRSSTDRYTLPDQYAGPDRSSVPDQYRSTGPDGSAGPDQYRSTRSDRSAGSDRYWRVAPDRAGTVEPRREQSHEPGRGREAGPERSRHAKVDRRWRSRRDHQGYSECSRKGGRRRFWRSSSASSSSEYSESDAAYEPSRGRQGRRGRHGRGRPRDAVENSGTAQILKALTGITNRLTALEAGHVHSSPAPNREEEEEEEEKIEGGCGDDLHMEIDSRMKNRESGVRIASRCRTPLLSMPLLSLPPQRCKSPKLFPPRLSQVLHWGQTNLAGNVTEKLCAASTHGTTRFRHQPHSLVRVWGVSWMNGSGERQRKISS